MMILSNLISIVFASAILYPCPKLIMCHCILGPLAVDCVSIQELIILSSLPMNKLNAHISTLNGLLRDLGDRKQYWNIITHWFYKHALSTILLLEDHLPLYFNTKIFVFGVAL